MNYKTPSLKRKLIYSSTARAAAASAVVVLWKIREPAMRSTDYPRASRAVFCSVLLLSQHAVVDANAWVTGRSSRSSTLAVAAPGGRDRPVRDWKAISRFDTRGEAPPRKQTGLLSSHTMDGQVDYWKLLQFPARPPNTTFLLHEDDICVLNCWSLVLVFHCR